MRNQLRVPSSCLNQVMRPACHFDPALVSEVKPDSTGQPFSVSRSLPSVSSPCPIDMESGLHGAMHVIEWSSDHGGSDDPSNVDRSKSSWERVTVGGGSTGTQIEMLVA